MPNNDLSYGITRRFIESVVSKQTLRPDLFLRPTQPSIQYASMLFPDDKTDG
jgi:hypothetical protein